ncbi:hypothetical protein [Pectobacterium carotovorum]|uniref:hypothetical protein n=1 Tax=Pectobacterium carotovorum TaxID=554 RepID=UPI00191F5746|nr:hypothetical protein [Pectobacterium carotovorum]
MTISTAGMIEAVRTAANMTKTQEEQDVLNSIANRIEILTAANAGMDLQLNSIRSALNIPDTQSVQSGVIDAFARQSSEITELTEKSNRLRRTAKEHQEENQQLRTKLEAYDRAEKEPAYWVYDTIFGLDISREKPEYEENTVPYFPVFKSASPASQSYTLRSATFDEIRDTVAEMTGGIPVTWCEGQKKGHHEVPFMNFNSLARIVDKFRASTFNHAGDLLTQPYAVPDEVVYEEREEKAAGWSTKPYRSYDYCVGWNACRAAMLQHETPVWSGIDWAKGCEPTQAVPEGWALVPANATAAMVSAAGRAAREYMEEYCGNSPQVIYQAMLAAAPQFGRG